MVVIQALPVFQKKKKIMADWNSVATRFPFRASEHLGKMKESEFQLASCGCSLLFCQGKTLQVAEESRGTPSGPFDFLIFVPSRCVGLQFSSSSGGTVGVEGKRATRRSCICRCERNQSLPCILVTLRWDAQPLTADVLYVFFFSQLVSALVWIFPKPPHQCPQHGGKHPGTSWQRASSPFDEVQYNLPGKKKKERKGKKEKKVLPTLRRAINHGLQATGFFVFVRGVWNQTNHIVP